ncbi:MAG TPA: thiamine phosphate synthase [Terriglobia bacterium]|jgi:thiamine-phosphate pyrophosphorylase
MIRYYVTDRRRGDILVCAERAVHDGVDMIQIREKDLPARELFELASRLRTLAAGTKTRILVNDRLDIALAAGLDGVHLPGNGLPPERVRGLVRMVGMSVHSIAEAVQAERASVDFVVFGPVFDSPGKTAVGLEPLRNVAAAVKIPVLAIGGVTLMTAGEVLNAGAAGIAGIRLFQHHA